MLWVVGILLAAAGAVLGLSALYPGALASQDAQTQLAYGLALVAILCASLAVAPRLRVREAIKVGFTWLAIFLVLVTVYRYQDGFRTLGREMFYVIDPSAPKGGEGGTVHLRASIGGHFLATAHVNGKRVRFLVDTGASQVVLTQGDARHVGIDVDDLDYVTPVVTANGQTYVAPVRLKSVKLGSIEMTNVQAAVARSEMDTSLLGMTFLRRLKSVEFTPRELVLTN